MENKFLLLIIAIMTIGISSVAQKTGSYKDSRDNKIYKTVAIGSQTWMAENLAFKADSGCWGYDDTLYNSVYGYFYNLETAKFVCPKGWHLPSADEWENLENYLGGKSVAGGKLKESGTNHWKSPNSGAINSSGFNALPGGLCYVNGTYKVGIIGWWIFSSNYEGCIRGLQYDSGTVSRGNIKDKKKSGFSVRCLKD